MNKTWLTKKLGEIIELHYGKGIARFDRKANGKYPIYGANGELGRTDKFLVEGDALIIGRKGTAGEVTRVFGKFWPADVTYYVFGNEQVDVDYLFYVLKRLDLKQLATGIKPGINRNKVYELEIPLPPIEEQKRIVEKIEKLFAKIDEASHLRAESSTASATLLPSALHQIFTCADKERWESSSIRQVSNNVITGSTPSTKEKSYFGGEIKWVTPGDFSGQMWIKESARSITDKAVKLGKVRAIPQKAVMLVAIGATVGKLGIAAERMTTNQQINSIIFNDKFVFPEFGYYAMLSIKEKIINIASTSTFPIINKTKTGELIIRYPKSLIEQKKIVAYLDSLSQKARKLQNLQSQTAADFSALRQSVLAQAFS